MFKAFVSHSGEDIELVQEFCDKANEKIPFVNFKYVMYSDRPGQDFMTNIITPMINESDFFIIFYTENGKASPLVNQELGYATCLGKYIIPIVDRAFLKESIGLLHSNISKFELIADKLKNHDKLYSYWLYSNVDFTSLINNI